MPPVLLQSMTRSGAQIVYRQQGQGFPLLLLHGWGGSSRYWQHTMECMAGSRMSYAPDLPGYGESPPRDNARTVTGAAEAVLGFADALGLEAFDLVAHSFTTSVATYVAAQAPARVRRLVLTCASTYRNERERQVVQQVHRLLGVWIRLRQPWMARTPLVYRTVAQRFFYRTPDDDGVLQESFRDFLRMDGPTAIAHANDVVKVDYHATLKRLAVPTLVVGTRQDNIMPTAGTPYLAALIPNGRLVWIDECGHLPMIECPEVYHRLLHEFLLSD